VAGLKACSHEREPFRRCLRLSGRYQESLGIIRWTEADLAAKTPNALLHGTLDALILKTLMGGPRHGYAIAKFIEDSSGDAVIVEEGSLYPALYRMERRGWLEAEWGESDLGRRAKLYRLTRQGRAQLAAEAEAWRLFTAGVSRILLAP